MNIEQWEKWIEVHSSFLWRVYYSEGEGILEIEDISVVANSMEEAIEIASAWANGVKDDGNRVFVTKVELLEWVCLR